MEAKETRMIRKPSIKVNIAQGNHIDEESTHSNFEKQEPSMPTQVYNQGLEPMPIPSVEQNTYKTRLEMEVAILDEQRRKQE